MKEFFLYRIIPFLLIGIFVLIMHSAVFLKQPFSKEDDVVRYLNAASENIQSENWEEASKNLAKVNKAFETVVKRIQFSVERNEVNMFDQTIEKTKGFVTVKEKAGAMAELSEAQHVWDQLEK
ncbi:DUF4363 family protein [Niallia endozanthoxylica]|uniref:DUF4363 family protein n=1 Tax=Niallia endozanthoxylica TaxID=2036016 RepID=A0A5J5GUT7_9BACI|nr:DUF4363 family protein [Niallia endozanthoxylica]KAA9012229.1 DUF4363 family protein [Niallia endozanthoxylica]